MRSLALSQIVEAAQRRPEHAVGAQQDGEILVSQLFHKVLCGLLGPRVELNLEERLTDVERDRSLWTQVAREHTYDRLLGQLLTQHQAQLQGYGEQCLALWGAIHQLLERLLDALWGGGEREPIDPSLPMGMDGGLRPPILEATLRHPEWHQEVRVVGRAEGLLSLPTGGGFRLLSYGGSPLAVAQAWRQAALYREIWAASEGSAPSIGLLCFGSGTVRTLDAPADLTQPARQALQLVGDLAGVRKSVPTSFREASADSADPLAERLVRGFRELGQDISIDGPAVVGSSIKRYRIHLGPRVRVARLARFVPDVEIRLNLSAPMRLTQEGGGLYIDVKREDRETLWLGPGLLQELRLEPAQPSHRMLAGINVHGKAQVIDLSHPMSTHVLIAGAPGSGKREWLRTALGSMILGNTPASLRVLFLGNGPLRSDLADSPFVLTPPSSDVQAILDGLIRETHRRQQTAAAPATGPKGQPLPRLLVVCDELRGLQGPSPELWRDLHNRMATLGARGRPAGIHLVIATEHPDRHAVSAVLKANLPARIALKATSTAESLAVIEAEGAERLLGGGDLLYKTSGHPIRLQGARLTEALRRTLFGPEWASALSGLG